MQRCADRFGKAIIADADFVHLQHGRAFTAYLTLCHRFSRVPPLLQGPGVREGTARPLMNYARFPRRYHHQVRLAWPERIRMIIQRYLSRLAAPLPPGYRSSLATEFVPARLPPAR
jgi:hypothetical protein